MRIRKIHDKGYEEGSGTVKDVGYKGTAVPAAAALAAAVFRGAGISKYKSSKMRNKFTLNCVDFFALISV